MTEEMKSAFYNKSLKTLGLFDPENIENKKRWVENQIKKLQEELVFIKSDIDEYKKKYKSLSAIIGSALSYFDAKASIAGKASSDSASRDFEKIKEEFIESFLNYSKTFIRFMDQFSRSDLQIIDREIEEQLKKPLEVKVYSPDSKIKLLVSLEGHQIELTDVAIIKLIEQSILDNNPDLFKFCLEYKEHGSQSFLIDSVIESPFSEDQEKLKNVISLLSLKVSDRDDRALFYKHLLSFALSPDDGKKEFLEKKFEFCLDALPVELKKEFLQYCNIEENIAQLIADETKLDEQQKIQISKQHQSSGVFKRVKRSFINTSIIESSPSSQFQNLQDQTLRDSESNSRVL